MALRKPLVIGSSGAIQQLQAGDTLDAPIDQPQQIVLTNDNVGSLVPGTPVYMHAADHVDKAKADAAATSEVVGLAAATITTGVAGSIVVSGVMSLTTGQWDAVCGTTGGLAFGTWYYLSDTTAGQLTSVAPSTVGHYLDPVGRGVSTTEMQVLLHQPIAL